MTLLTQNNRLSLPVTFSASTRNGSGFLPRIACGLLLIATAWPVSAGDAWTSFHNGGSTSIADDRLPLNWAPEQGIAWAKQLPGYGQSAPIVWQDRVYVTAVDGKDKETCIVAAYDAATGNEIWRREFAATLKKPYGYTVSRAAPTPIVDAEALYLVFESGDVFSLTHAGEQRWNFAFLDDAANAFVNNHGYAASPAQTNDALILLVDHTGPSYLAAYSKETGEQLWKTERTSRSSWTSPQVARLGDSAQIVISSNGTVDGYDAATGKQLWTYGQIVGNTIPSVAIEGDRVYVGAGESRRGGGATPASCCLRILPGSEAGFEVLWRAEKAVCSYSSPLAHQGHVYYVNNVGVLRCVDAATGELKYETRMGEPCWAQPIASGDRLYFFGKRGTTKVVQAGPEFKELASNEMWTADNPPVPPKAEEAAGGEGAGPGGTPSEEYLDPVVYGVAAVDGAFYVRLGTHLYRVGTP